MFKTLDLNEIAESIGFRSDRLTEERKVIAASIAEGNRITSSDLDELATISAKQEVLQGLAGFANLVLAGEHPDADMTQERARQLIVDAVQRHVTSWRPSSSSVMSNEIDYRKHYYALELLNAFEGKGFATI